MACLPEAIRAWVDKVVAATLAPNSREQSAVVALWVALGESITPGWSICEETDRTRVLNYNWTR